MNVRLQCQDVRSGAVAVSECLRGRTVTPERGDVVGGRR